MRGYGGFVVFQTSWYSKRDLWKKMLSWIDKGPIRPAVIDRPGYPAFGCVGGSIWTNLYIEAFAKIMGVNAWQSLTKKV